MNRHYRYQIICLILALMMTAAFLSASPQEELPGRTFVQGVDESMESITLTGVVRMLGDARTSSPALILDEDGITQTGGVSSLGLIGPGARSLVNESQGSTVSIQGRLLSKEDYEKEYRQLYPLRYGPFGGYLFVPGEQGEPSGEEPAAPGRDGTEDPAENNGGDGA
ncbi:hypothetical protein [Salinispira pacifica]|uniref:Uncharacterized protein n=1 Tax=Salinispira pacifica TaxID=1307761 RepID=V5WF92_9SPIO|nr:hypothetical protein [Salinispira pacifica]AHC14214.1 hypothetical protein L21SP2_0792 [Salinispira pacifica]